MKYKKYKKYEYFLSIIFLFLIFLGFIFLIVNQKKEVKDSNPLPVLPETSEFTFFNDNKVAVLAGKEVILPSGFENRGKTDAKSLGFECNIEECGIQIIQNEKYTFYLGETVFELKSGPESELKVIEESGFSINREEVFTIGQEKQIIQQISSCIETKLCISTGLMNLDPALNKEEEEAFLKFLLEVKVK